MLSNVCTRKRSSFRSINHRKSEVILHIPSSCMVLLCKFLIISTLRRLIGGKAQSTANLVEGLACCLQFFDDIKSTRDGCQKYCVLICNSPPNMMPVMENDQYSGSHLEHLASLFGEVSNYPPSISYRVLATLFYAMMILLISEKNYDVNSVTQKDSGSI